MKKWNICRISDFATIGRGSSPRPITDQKYFVDGQIPWVKIADATASGKTIYKTKEYVNEYGASFSRLLKKGSLILSASGVSLGIPRFLGVDGCIHDGWLYLEEFHNINVSFLYYKLLTLQPYFLNLSYGAAIQNINTEIFSKTKILVPDTLMQERIANILSRYDEAIENNKKRIKLLEQISQSLYKEWFVRLRFPGNKLCQFENGIPINWHQGRLFELLEFKRGKNITADEMEEGEIPVISAGIEPSGYHKEANVKGTALTISSSGANAGYLSIHYEDIWAADCMFVTEENTKNIYYLYELLNNIRPVIGNQQRGAAQPHVYANDINHLRLWIPNEELIEKANDILKPLHKEIYQLQKANRNLAKQRDLLLPRLMSRKLEVK